MTRALGVVQPCELYAGMQKDRLRIYRSPIIRDYHVWLEPVWEYLNDFCYVLESMVTIDDESMVFGQAKEELYRIYQECPGHITHNCKKGGGCAQT